MEPAPLQKKKKKKKKKRIWKLVFSIAKSLNLKRKKKLSKDSTFRWQEIHLRIK
jgi:hypothetical protein